MEMGYLSGAPRVSTQNEAELSGPSRHVMGMIDGFKLYGYHVKQFIMGDRLTTSWLSFGSRKWLNANLFNRLLADLIRIYLNRINSHQAYFEIGRVDFVYERFGVFQSLGKQFKQNGIPWILETNALLYKEASTDRKTIELKKIAYENEKRAYNECDLLVCVSDTLKTMIQKEIEIPEEKILVSPNGVDTELFNPDLTKPIRFFNEITVGYVGELERWQSLDLLIEAVSELRGETRLCILIVGDGSDSTRLRKIVNDLDMEDNVHFTGRLPLDFIPSYIAGCDICYSGHTTTKAGEMYFSPLKTYEYLSMAKPIITSDFAEARNLINGQFGFLFLPGDKESLKNALVTASRNYKNWFEIGKIARGTIINEHSWQARVSKLLARIETL